MLLQTSLVLGLKAAADDVNHSLTLATWTLVLSCCKAQLFMARCTLALFGP